MLLFLFFWRLAFVAFASLFQLEEGSLQCSVVLPAQYLVGAIVDQSLIKHGCEAGALAGNIAFENCGFQLRGMLGDFAARQRLIDLSQFFWTLSRRPD